MRLIDADDFGNRMYHEAFEKDSDLQKWDSGCWIRYKIFENVLREQPTIMERTETLLDDGTLMLECDSDLSKVARVNVRQRGTHNGDLFYRDED